MTLKKKALIVAIKNEVLAKQAGGMPLVNSKLIVHSLKENAGLEVREWQVRRVLKRDMGLSFIKSKKIYPNANSMKVKIQRQQYALSLISLIESGKRIINIDETWLNETSFIRKLWGPKGGYGNIRLKTVSPRVSLIAALDTNGNVWYCLSHAATDSDVIALFMNSLVKILDQEQPGW